MQIINNIYYAMIIYFVYMLCIIYIYIYMSLVNYLLKNAFRFGFLLLPTPRNISGNETRNFA